MDLCQRKLHEHFIGKQVCLLTVVDRALYIHRTDAVK